MAPPKVPRKPNRMKTEQQFDPQQEIMEQKEEQYQDQETQFEDQQEEENQPKKEQEEQRQQAPAYQLRLRPVMIRRYDCILYAKLSIPDTEQELRDLIARRQIIGYQWLKTTLLKAFQKSFNQGHPYDPTLLQDH